MSHSNQPERRPLIRDYALWNLTLQDHRRALFERFLQECPALQSTRRTDIEVWRTRLSGRRMNYPVPLPQPGDI
jgi:hypothetical protein